MNEARLFNPLFIAVFLLVFTTLSLARLPAALMLPYLQQAGITAAGAEGTLWQARFARLAFQNMTFDSGAYRLQPLGFLTGGSIGAFSLRGPLARLSGNLEGVGNNRIGLSDLQIFVDYPLVIRRMKLAPQLNLSTDSLVLSQDGQCVSGDIAIAMSLNHPLLGTLLPQGNQWDGSAGCANGRAEFLLNPRDRNLTAVIRGRIEGNRYQAEIDLALDDGLVDNPRVISVLKSAGFKKRQGRWLADVKGVL